MPVPGPFQVSQTPSNSVTDAMYNISGKALIKTGKGFLGTVSIITEGGADIPIYDSADGVDLTKQIATLPSKGIYSLQWPFYSGLFVDPTASGAVISVSFS